MQRLSFEGLFTYKNFFFRISLNKFITEILLFKVALKAAPENKENHKL
jgi:hypothetical protein